MENNMTFNNTSVRKVPINRNSLFYSEECFNFDMEIGKQYLEQDCGQSVILYQVDIERTNMDDVYNETKSNQIVFKAPIELHVLYTIEAPEVRSYEKSKNLGTYVKGGKLKFGVYQATLDELECEIKTGDYIAIQVTQGHREVFVVQNDGRNNFDNAHTTFGLKPAYRTIEAYQVDINEFNGYF